MTRLMIMMRAQLLSMLVVTLVTSSVAVEESRHERHRSIPYSRSFTKRGLVHSNNHESNATKLSYSGSLDDLRAEAQEMADANTMTTPKPPTTPSPTTLGPTLAPSTKPSSPSASKMPTWMSAAPSQEQATGNNTPTTAAPSTSPTTTTNNSAAPTTLEEKSGDGTTAPTFAPTAAPSSLSSLTDGVPTAEPSSIPTVVSQQPSSVPSESSPTASPAPTYLAPSSLPSDVPSSLPSDVPSSVPSSVPSGPEMNGEQQNGAGDSLIQCSDTPHAGHEYITYRYALETQAGYDAGSIQETLEKSLNIHLATMLLPCMNLRRLLAEKTELGVNGIDSFPTDEPDLNSFCTPTLNEAGNTCTVLDGNMTMYYTEGADVDLIRYHVLLEIRDFLGGTLSLSGVASTFYLGPKITEPSSAKDSDENDNDSLSSTRSVEGPSILLIALGGLSFVALLGISIYLVRTRRSRRPTVVDDKDTPSHDDDIILPQVPTADTELGLESPTTDQESDDRSPLSPFSSMLPNAYRFDDNLSIILETESNDTRNSENILISDGYSTPDESSLHSSLNQSNFTATPVLGARRREDESLLDF